MTSECIILCVVGARPNYMKIAPVLRALKDRKGVSARIVHTGQHYDPELTDRLFAELELPPPDYHLGVGSATHAVQTARVLERIEPLLIDIKPAVVLVPGDVNSTLAAGIASVKLGIPVGHIEAGLRSFDRAMPEEINRVLIDRIADIHYTTEPEARENLLHEGVSEDSIAFVGNLMIDTQKSALGRAPDAQAVVRKEIGEAAAAQIQKRYAVLTLHRPSNVDVPQSLSAILHAVGEVSRKIPIVFPVHPRTRQRMTALGEDFSAKYPGLLMMRPAGYLDMLGLARGAALVLTDSGGLQEETTALGVPCLTLRENTERPVTVTVGTNKIVGCDPAKIISESHAILSGNAKVGGIPEGWDGRAAERLADHLMNWLASH